QRFQAGRTSRRAGRPAQGGEVESAPDRRAGTWLRSFARGESRARNRASGVRGGIPDQAQNPALSGGVQHVTAPTAAMKSRPSGPSDKRGRSRTSPASPYSSTATAARRNKHGRRPAFPPVRPAHVVSPDTGRRSG